MINDHDLIIYRRTYMHDTAIMVGESWREKQKVRFVAVRTLLYYTWYTPIEHWSGAFDIYA